MHLFIRFWFCFRFQNGNWIYEQNYRTWFRKTLDKRNSVRRIVNVTRKPSIKHFLNGIECSQMIVTSPFYSFRWLRCEISNSQKLMYNGRECMPGEFKNRQTINAIPDTSDVFCISILQLVFIRTLPSLFNVHRLNGVGKNNTHTQAHSHTRTLTYLPQYLPRK